MLINLSCDIVLLSQVFKRRSALKLLSASALDAGHTRSRRTSFSTCGKSALMFGDIVWRSSAASDRLVYFIQRNMTISVANDEKSISVYGFKVSQALASASAANRFFSRSLYVHSPVLLVKL